MSTSSVCTVKRRASSFARSRTSPTSRSSRAPSRAMTSREAARASGSSATPSRKRVDMTTNRGQRGTQLVRDAHEEVALLPLGVGQARGHLPEAVGKVSDLTAPAHVRQVDVVAAPRNLVGRTRERKHGPRNAAGQVPAEQPRDDDSAERRDRQPLQEWNQLVVQFRLRLRHDQVAECGPLLPQLQGTSDSEIGLLCARWRELERDRSAGTPVDCALR